MARRLGIAGGTGVLAVVFLCGGCAGFLAGDWRGRDRFVEALRVEEACTGGPALASDTARSLPAASYSTIYANGLVWIGYNVATAEGGDLGVYDNGEGAAFGLAFGDGQNLKRFFEVGYERTGGHEVASGTSEANHERYYLGVRSYIFSIAEEAGGRVVAFLVGGVTFQTLKGSNAVATESGDVVTAQGGGIYVGTGLEIKLGSSSQVALALDLRGSYIAYDGSPEGTGNQVSVGSAMALILHF